MTDSFHGAELQNLLKLFEALFDGSLLGTPKIPQATNTKELIIY